MKNWEIISIGGLSKPDGSDYEITISCPRDCDNSFACHVVIPGLVDRNIEHESALSALTASLSLVERLLYEPAEGIIRETTLTEEDFPDLSIEIR